MTAPNYTVPMEQGVDWDPVLNWYAGGIFRAPIEEINPGYPTRIQVTAHGLPSASDTPVIISGVEGMGILNSKNLAIFEATYVDADHFDMPLSTVKQEWVIGTGEITYYQPTDISALTFRAQLRSRVHKDTILADLTTANGKIVTNTNDASIQLVLTAAETAALNFTEAYLDCESVDGSGGVKKVFSLNVPMIREATR